LFCDDSFLSKSIITFFQNIKIWAFIDKIISFNCGETDRPITGDLPLDPNWGFPSGRPPVPPFAHSKYATDPAGPPKALSTLETIVAVLGNSRRTRRLSPNSATVADFGDCRRIPRQIVAVFGDYSLGCGQAIRQTEVEGAGMLSLALVLGPWLSLRTKLQSLVLALALNLQSLVLSLALRVESLVLALALKVSPWSWP